MPIYTYRCEKCGAQEEHLQKVDDEPVETCQECGGDLKRIIKGTSFKLEGGGWYKDGYASPPPGSSGSGGGDKKKAASG